MTITTPAKNDRVTFVCSKGERRYGVVESLKDNKAGKPILVIMDEKKGGYRSFEYEKVNQFEYVDASYQF